MGWHQMGEGLGLDPADERQGAPAAGSGGQGLRIEKPALAETYGGLRQVHLKKRKDFTKTNINKPPQEGRGNAGSLRVPVKKGRKHMRLKYLFLGAAFAGILCADALATKADAQDSIYVPLLTYRTGPFAGSGIPIANGMADYLKMLNERDGGIGGVKLAIEECETGYDTKKGVECYEQVKSKKPVMINPYSTGITLQLIPKAAVDKIPILSMAYGLSASAVGDDFPWIFNPPATYWDGLSMMFRYIGGKVGGLDKLKGKTIGYIFFDGGYGREPIPLLEQFAKDYGFEVKLYPVPAAEMQNQSAQWLNVRRDKPDYMIMWG